MSRGRPFARGFDPRRGVGLKGRSGRKTAAWRAFALGLLEDPDVQDVLRAAVRDRHAPGYVALLRLVAAYAVGLPRAEADPLDGLAHRIAALSEAELERLQRAPETRILELIAAADTPRNRAIAPTDRCHLHPRHFGVVVLRLPKPGCLSERGKGRATLTKVISSRVMTEFSGTAS